MTSLLRRSASSAGSRKSAGGRRQVPWVAAAGNETSKRILANPTPIELSTVSRSEQLTEELVLLLPRFENDALVQQSSGEKEDTRMQGTTRWAALQNALG